MTTTAYKCLTCNGKGTIPSKLRARPEPFPCGACDGKGTVDAATHGVQLQIQATHRAYRAKRGL